MTSKSEITKAVAIELCRLDAPNEDPVQDIELIGVAMGLPYARIEGTGVGARQYGPRYLRHWREASRLAIAVEVAQRTA